MKYERSRRYCLAAFLSAGGWYLMNMFFPVRKLRAMGEKHYPQGVRELEGEVVINGKPAKLDDTVQTGDVVETGLGGRVIFVTGADVYLLHEKTRLTISREGSPSLQEKAVRVLKLTYGRMLSVFGEGERRIVTKTAIAGIRGSAAYLGVYPEWTYFCLCYGRAELNARGDTDIREIIETTHHESPRFIYGGESGKPIEKGPVINHTDEELIMLESLVGRKPPFMETVFRKKKPGGNGGY
jgi:hypothetical protein